MPKPGAKHSGVESTGSKTEIQGAKKTLVLLGVIRRKQSDNIAVSLNTTVKPSF